MTEDKDFDKSKINEKELLKFAYNYSEDSLLHKISKFGAHIGLELFIRLLSCGAYCKSRRFLRRIRR